MISLSFYQLRNTQIQQQKKKNGSDRICILHRGQRADLACRTGMVVRKNRTHWSHRGGKTQLSTRSDGSHENFHLSCLSSRLVSLQEEHDKRRVSVQVGISNCDGGVWWKRLEEKKIRQTDRHTDRGGWLIYMDGFWVIGFTVMCIRPMFPHAHSSLARLTQ